MNITNAANLKQAISLLQNKRQAQKKQIAADATVIYQSIQPINIIKNTINKLIATPAINNNALDMLMGVGAGMVSKKLILGKSASIIKKVLGGVIEFGVSNIIASNATPIKSFGIALFSKIVGKKNNKQSTY